MTAEEELEQLRAENAALRKQVSALEDLVSILQEQLQQVRDQLAKDSHNSGLPPSSNRFQRQPPKSLRKKSGKKPGGQPGHQGRHLQMVSEPDEILVHEVSHCAECGQDLAEVSASLAERRQVVELPSKRLHVREHQVQEKVCPSCWCLTRSHFPEQVCGPVSYGHSIGALAVYLVQYQLVPLARASALLEDLLGVTLSEASIQSLIQRTAEPLASVEEQLKTALSQQQVIHQDETSLYVAGKPHWVHVCSTATLTHYGAHRKRGQEAMDAIGIAPRFTGTSVHDGLLSYQKYGCTHAACNAHYLRELTFVEEQYQHPWARKMKALLLAGKRLVQRAREAGQTSLDVSLLARLRFQYDTLVTEGLLKVPASPHQPRGPGRNREHPARKLLLRLHSYREQILRFLHDFAVPFDNNQAERDLRMLKVQQKISGGFRQEKGIVLFCRIRSYLSTLRKQGLPLLAALEQTLRGQPLLPVFSTPI